MGNLVLVALLVVASGCRRSTPATAKSSRQLMGTFAEVTAVAFDPASARRAVEAAYARLEQVERLMSDYVGDSEIGRINGLPAGRPLAVSRETFHCLQRAVEISELSGGAFDVTCRPLVHLWKRAGAEDRLPSAAALQEALGRVGWQKLRLDPRDRAVTLTVDGMQIDLGGIAKGYALDLAAEAMRDSGASGGLVNVGGDVLAVGRQASGRPWRIGVQHPFEPGLFCTLALTDQAVATSGVQQRYVEIEGKRYSHIVDPRSGWPAEQAPSVTVIAPDGLTADAWATAFSVLSVEQGQALLTRKELAGIEVMWITHAESGVLVHCTPGFARYLANPSDPAAR